MERRRLLKRQALVVSIAVAVTVTTMFIAFDAYRFVQRAHTRCDSIVNLLREQYEYELKDGSEYPIPAFSVLTMWDCDGDEGKFLGRLFDSDADTVYYAKVHWGSYMWFTDSAGHTTFVRHVLY